MKISADEFLSYLTDNIVQPLYLRMDEMSKEAQVKGLPAEKLELLLADE